MPRIIDEEGNLFGIVNVVDAMAVLLVFAVMVAGAALVLQTDTVGSDTSDRAEVEIEVEEHARVIDAISRSDPISEDVVKPYSDTNVRIVKELKPAQNHTGYRNYDRSTYRATVTLNLEGQIEKGAFHFRGEHLYVGKQVKIELTQAVVNGTVRSINPIPGGDNE